MEYKCSTCLDTLFSVNTDVYVTPCGHLFHKNCIERCMQDKLECPNCNTVLAPDSVKKVHPDVCDELACDDCSIETRTFLEKIYDFDKEKRITMLQIIKKLDKENRSLKEKSKKIQENYKTCKTFFKSFQKDIKDWQEKSQKLNLKNNTLLAEIYEVNHVVEFNIVEELNNIQEVIIDEEINNESENSHKESDYKSHISETINNNLNISSDKNQLYKEFSKETEKQLKEIHDNDNKIYELLLHKVLDFVNENKTLIEKNIFFQKQLSTLKEATKDVQNYSEMLKQNYKLIQVKNDLLVVLQRSKMIREQIEAKLSVAPVKIKRKTTEGQDYSCNISRENCSTNQGLLT